MLSVVFLRDVVPARSHAIACGRGVHARAAM
jgi:hypothetical protein